MTRPMRPKPGRLGFLNQFENIYYHYSRSQSESEQVDELTEKIDVFLKAEHATPEQVKEVAQECLDSEMLMDADQIKALADEINAATGKPTSLLNLPTHMNPNQTQ